MRHLVLAIALCAFASFAAPDVDAKTTIRLGHSNAPTSPKGRAADKFAELVKQYTDGRVTVKIFPSSQLGNNRKMFTAVKTRGIEMTLTPYPLLADIVPEYTTLTAGYFYENWDQLRKIVEAPELGQAWDGGRLHLPLRVSYNGELFGKANAGVDMTFDFPTLIAHAAKTRPLCAGTIIGSGTVSNKDDDGTPGRPVADGGLGYSCIAEIRMIETIRDGKPTTPFMQFGDRVRLEMLDADGNSLFGAIDQQVQQQG